jgi:hypothetical protein
MMGVRLVGRLINDEKNVLDRRRHCKKIPESIVCFYAGLVRMQNVKNPELIVELAWQRRRVGYGVNHSPLSTFNVTSSKRGENWTDGERD